MSLRLTLKLTQVAYRGPLPTHAEYADATLKAARAALTETGDGATSFTLQHVPAALLSLANAAGIDSSKVSPFLADIGIGLTATGKTAEQVCSSRPGTKQSLLKLQTHFSRLPSATAVLDRKPALSTNMHCFHTVRDTGRSSQLATVC